MFLFSFLSCAQPGVAADIRPVQTADNKCDILILGEISGGDEIRFRNAVVSVLRSGCKVPRVNIYSPGGSYEVAIKIANDIRVLHAVTVAPRLTFARKGRAVPPDSERSCPLIPGEHERVGREYEKQNAEIEATTRAWQQGSLRQSGVSKLGLSTLGQGRGIRDARAQARASSSGFPGLNDKGTSCLCIGPTTIRPSSKLLTQTTPGRLFAS